MVLTDDEVCEEIVLPGWKYRPRYSANQVGAVIKIVLWPNLDFKITIAQIPAEFQTSHCHRQEIHNSHPGTI